MTRYSSPVTREWSARAIVRRLQAEGFRRLVLRERRELDLRDQAAVTGFFESARPQFVFLAAARVGGILANDSYPAEFLRDNLAIQTNVIDAAYRAGVKKLLFLGSSCIYPKQAPQPMPEECLLSGPLEPTNEWYAIAKIAGLKMCQAYRRQYGFRAISAMPTNLYGPGDNFSLKGSHVLPALIRKVHEAKERETARWRSGEPELRAASSCMWTTWRMPACCSCGNTRASNGSMSGRGRRSRSPGSPRWWPRRWGTGACCGSILPCPTGRPGSYLAAPS